MTTANDLLRALSRAFVLTESRPGDDPELLEEWEDIRELQETLGWQVVRVGETDFTILGEIVPAEAGDEGRFREALTRARIRELRIQDVLDPEAWDGFFRRLRSSTPKDDLPGPDRFRGLEEVLGISFHPRPGPLRGMAGSIQSLFESPEGDLERPSAPSAPSGPAEVPVEDVSPDPPPDASPELSPDASPDALPEPPLSPGLEGKVEAFFSAGGAERDRLAAEIQREAHRMKDVRDLNGVADLLEALAEPRKGARDDRGLDLARRIITPGAASQLVARLGAAREEDARARLTQISAGLGREMAAALSDALGEARDRYQRRSFLEALSAQGDLALEVAEEMVEDPRWFVVRNGVSLLGEMGGEGAVSHLTGPLANPDPRVRRETVLALARIGGPDADQLLLGMLDDQEAEVRAMACRALGVLKVERALKPLLRILEKDQDEDVQVECLQALGKLGDPGAVPLIEKRGLGGLFSRPGKEIRVAAYRALAGIGTPHAMKLLEKAAGDSDAGIRSVVEGLLSQPRSDQGQS